jgi:hypothetical protein
MADATIDLLSQGGRTRHEFTWIWMATHFQKFTATSYQNTAHIVPFSAGALQRLEQASSSPEAPIMEEEDAELLNYLQVSDFRWPYKYYKTEKDLAIERMRQKDTYPNFATVQM